MINYGKYKYVRNASWQVLLDYNVRQLPVKITDIAKQADIKVVKNSDCHLLKDNQIGLSILIDSKWYIVFDDNMSSERARFTIAHELGHIFLGHISLLNRSDSENEYKEKPEEETQADMFAARLLAPACVLWGLHLHSANDISQICNISYQAATYRAQRMELLYKRNKFLTSQLERKVYSNFENFIKQYNKGIK